VVDSLAVLLQGTLVAGIRRDIEDAEDVPPNVGVEVHEVSLMPEEARRVDP
jgi:hypothetical protein